jgi:hypothetical protein
MAETLSPEQQAALLKEAEQELRRAQTADEVRAVWRKYYLQVGHRKLGRLLVGPNPGKSVSSEEG